MFVIKPNDYEEWQHAMFILSYYHVRCTIHSDGDNFESAYMVVDSTDEDNPTTSYLHMAEAAFQMNWHQGGVLCHHCEDINEALDVKETTCGHLTFVRRINPAF
jgi:hypothetical protein